MNNFCIASGRLWQQILVRGDQVRELHSFAVGIPARAQDMAFQEDSIRVVGSDRENMDFVAILDHEFFKSNSQNLFVARFADVQIEHGTLLVRLDALYLDVVQCAGGEDAPCQLKKLGEILFPSQLIGRRAPYHSIDSDRWAQRRQAKRIAALQPASIPTDSVQEQVVGIHFFHELLAPVMLETSQGAKGCDAPSAKEGIQRLCQRADVVPPWRRDSTYTFPANG